MARNDLRYRWLSETISMLLGIFDTKYADTLIDENVENIKSFFDDEITEFVHINRQTLFVWRTFYDKMVEETITVLEEGKKISINFSNMTKSSAPQTAKEFYSLNH